MLMRCTKQKYPSWPAAEPATQDRCLSVCPWVAGSGPAMTEYFGLRLDAVEGAAL